MAGKWDVFGRLDELEASARELRGTAVSHGTRLGQHDAELTARANDVVRLETADAAHDGLLRTAERRIDEAQSSDVILRSELDRLTERVAALEGAVEPTPEPGPDLSEYVAAMDALLVEHGPEWRQTADVRDVDDLETHDRVRYVIDGLTNLADATDLRGYASAAIDLCARVAAAYPGSTGSTWTADTRMAAVFPRAARVADRLGIDGSAARAHAEAVFRSNEHRKDWCLSREVYEGQIGAMARIARGVDEVFARDAVERLLSEVGRRSVYGAGLGSDDSHPGGRTFWRSGREFEWMLRERPDLAEPMWVSFWGRCELDRNGRTFFASHIDGHVQDGWEGWCRFADGLALLPEARPYVRACLGMEGPSLADLMEPTAAQYTRGVNSSDAGWYEAANLGGLAWADAQRR